MRYVSMKKAFGIENLSIESGYKPKPGDDEVLVRIRAVSLNYVDLAVVTGKLDSRIPIPFVPVADGAGTVEETGRNVRNFKPGDRVATVYIPSWRGGRYRREHTSLAIRPGAGTVPGQLAEYKVFRSHELIRVPDFLDAAEASTLPIAALTAWNALAYGRVKAGDTVLLHGTGGVSVFALQFAKVCGARVIITSGSDRKIERAASLGADLTINYKDHPDVGNEVMRITDREGVDVVVDTVGGGNLEQSLESLKAEGHISVVGFLAGVEAVVNLISLNLKRATITGVSVGSVDDFYDMISAISANRIKPVIDSRFPMDETIQAFRRLERGDHFGKIVIEI